MTDWVDVAARLDGRKLNRHAVLTFNGTWGAGLVQYPSNVVNGLAEFVDDRLCFEVPVPGPYSFGPLGGAVNAPSYQQSVQQAVDWAIQWIIASPQQTFVLIGYSLGAEAASRVLMWLQGDGREYLPNFIGGITFGNPSRGEGFHAPTIADPGGHGVSATRMPELPTIDGRVVWADYVHSPANGDAGLDMYPSVPVGRVGEDMVDVYEIATNFQLGDLTALAQSMGTLLTKAAMDSGLIDAAGQGLTGLLTLGWQFILGMIEEAIGAAPSNPTAGEADGMAAVEGLRFLAAPGGPTAPHISYLGEIPGYSNQVADAVGFLHGLATAANARRAA